MVVVANGNYTVSDIARMDVGDAYRLMHRYISEGSVEGVRDVRQAAIKMGHDGLLEYAAVAEDALRKGYDPDTLGAEGYEEAAESLVTGEERFHTLRNAIGSIRKEGDDEVIEGHRGSTYDLVRNLVEAPEPEKYAMWFIDPVTREPYRLVLVEEGQSEQAQNGDVYRQAPGIEANGVVARLYRQLLWNSDVDGRVYETLLEAADPSIVAEFSNHLSKFVDLFVLEAGSLEEADALGEKPYKTAVIARARQNLEGFGKAMASGTYPENVHFLYANAVIGLAGVLGLSDQAKQAYSTVAADLLNYNFRRAVYDPRVVELAERFGAIQGMKEAYAALVEQLYEGGETARANRLAVQLGMKPAL